MITSDLLNDLQIIVSDERVVKGQNGDDFLGNSGRIVVKPESEEEITKILQYANAHNRKISIAAGGTKRGFGGITEAEDIELSLENFKGIMEHTVGDMTLTVKSGTPFKELQAYLAQYNQKISLDPFYPERATIGGIIAANDSGPKRLGYGSARDAVIGLRIAYPNGSVIRTGGKVVKNVAGYDMNKLFIGSMGTIGVITEVTLKLRPLPQYESVILLAFPDGHHEWMKSFAVELLDSMMEPVALELLSPTLSENLTGCRYYTVAISFEDVEASVHYQEEFVKKLSSSFANISILEKEKACQFWEHFYNIDHKESEKNETKATLKIAVINLDVIRVIKECEYLSDIHNLKIEGHGGFGHGLCHVHLSGAVEDVKTAITQLRKLATELNGYAVLKYLPLKLRQEINVWGEEPSYFSLLKGIKEKIDPKKILNPGRFVGGI
ncbi:FAD-binding oxidoreductase [Robertmurraya sp. DFI.2.37]|uniref:FAD-binding oxidoreductase n=1 Tax=Robertmurraya sp. DFI.2.37 TaxID=3031819 RepID=UPI0012447D8F|nr:FAD-binding oxidoreductase [Robertmurraya sp. DFI.2.37]MDF1508449.1 FAD-binding oxidoreductase [Robertmurraya sp. DFI.2.37]